MKEIKPEDVSARLNKLFEEKGLIERQVAADLEVPYCTFQNWKRFFPSSLILYKTAKYLDVSMEEILAGEKSKSKKELSDNETELIKWFRKLPVSKQNAVLKIIE